MKAWLVAGLLIVAVAGCGDGKKTPAPPLVILEYEVAPLDGQTETQARDLVVQVMRTRIDARRTISNAVVVGRGTSQIHVELEGEPQELESTIEYLEQSAALGVHPVVEDDATMRAIYDVAMQEKPPGVFPMTDTWQGPDGAEHRSPYVWSADPKILDQWLRARPPEQQVTGGRRIVLEHVDVSTAQGPDQWRTHVIDLAAIVTGKDVATAGLTYDQNTMRPEVEVSLTADGARRFGDATAALVGHKLAIVLDAKVVSAPVVNSRIPGGRIVIAMGAGDQQQLEHQANDLVEMLKTGSMPPVMRVSERHVGPAR